MGKITVVCIAYYFISADEMCQRNLKKSRNQKRPICFGDKAGGF